MALQSCALKIRGHSSSEPLLRRQSLLRTNFTRSYESMEKRSRDNNIPVPGCLYIRRVNAVGPYLNSCTLFVPSQSPPRRPKETQTIPAPGHMGTSDQQRRDRLINKRRQGEKSKKKNMCIPSSHAKREMPRTDKSRCQPFPMKAFGSNRLRAPAPSCVRPVMSASNEGRMNTFMSRKKNNECRGNNAPSSTGGSAGRRLPSPPAPQGREAINAQSPCAPAKKQ